MSTSPKRRRRHKPGVRPAEQTAPTSGAQQEATAAGRGVVMGAALLVLAAVVFVTFRIVIDPDMWFHLKIGEWITAQKSLPKTDPFSYTAGDTPYVPSGWLTAVLMHALDGIYPYSSLGPIAMVTVVVALAAGMVLWRGVRVGAPVCTALLLLAGLLLAVTRFHPRPDVWSFLGLTTLLYLISRLWIEPGESGRPRAGALWCLVPLVALWSNLHAGVLVAVPFLAIAIAWAAWQYRKTRDGAWLRVLAPMAVASVAWLANPYGVGLVGLARRIAEIPSVEWVMEWMPFFKRGFAMPWPVHVAALVLLGAIVVAITTGRRHLHPVALCWMVMLVGLALWQRRHLGLAAAGLPLLLAPCMGAAEQWLMRRGRGIALGALVCATAFVGWAQVSGANGTGGGWPRYGRNCTALPCYVTEFLERNPPAQPIFNSYNIGGYLLNALSPDLRVYIDGRLDTYPHQVWQDMLAVEENRLSIDDMMARYGINTFVITSGDSFGDPVHLASRLAARSDFELIYLDDLAAVFTRRTPESVEWLEHYAYRNVKPWNLDAMRAGLTTPAQVNLLTNEMGRMLEMSPQSAAVRAVAVYIAALAGDEEVMNEQRAIAHQLRSDYPLLRQVELKLSGRRGR